MSARRFRRDHRYSGLEDARCSRSSIARHTSNAQASRFILASIMKPLLTTRDLAGMTGLSMDYFQRLSRAGKIPCQRLGYGPRAMFLFDAVEFERWWQANLRR